MEHCEAGKVLLHNLRDRVPLSELKRLPMRKRKSLGLIRSRKCKFVEATSYTGRSQIRCHFRYGGSAYDLVVTDSLAERRVRQGEILAQDCILTISLGMPWPETSNDPDCYKLVAGVIEL